MIIGRVSADAVRAVFFSAVMLAAALIFGSGMHAGVGGVFVVLLMAAVFGAAYSGIGIFVAMRTANAQAAQASFLLFFPLLFMAPAFAPKEIFAPWMQAVATVNPVTYMMEGIRELVLGDYASAAAVKAAGGSEQAIAAALGNGWDGERMLWAFVSLIGFGLFTLTIAALAMRSRAGSG